MSESSAPIGDGRTAKNGETPCEKTSFCSGFRPFYIQRSYVSCDGLGYSSRDAGGSREGSGPPNLQVGGINGTDQKESLSQGRDFVAGRGLLDRVGRNFVVSEDR
jgi:hypothetical protein